MPSSFHCSDTRMLLLLLCLLVKIEAKCPLSISAYASSSVIFPPSLVSSRPILPFAVLLLSVYLTLFLSPFTTSTNQYLILCLSLFWFCPFVPSYPHLLSPAFLLVHFLWPPFLSHACRKPLVQVQYIDLSLVHILVSSKRASAVVHQALCSSETSQRLQLVSSIAFVILNLSERLFSLLPAQLQGGVENATTDFVVFSWKGWYHLEYAQFNRNCKGFTKTLITS